MRTKDKALRWGHFQNKGLRQGDSLGPHPKAFTYPKAQGKIYYKSNL